MSVVLPADDPLAVMRDRKGEVREHRLVVARRIGRALLTEEQIHHLNGDKRDNRLENLRIMSPSDHSREPHEEIRRLRARIVELETLLEEK